MPFLSGPGISIGILEVIRVAIVLPGYGNRVIPYVPPPTIWSQVAHVWESSSDPTPPTAFAATPLFSEAPKLQFREEGKLFSYSRILAECPMSNIP